MTLKGNPVSKGVAVGPLFVYQPFEAAVTECYCEAPAAEEHLRRYHEAKAAAGKELDAIYEKLALEDPEKAKIFIAHKDILNDEAIEEEIAEGITEELWACEWAVSKVFSKFTRMLKKAPDPIIQERAADLQDVGNRLLRILHGVEERNLSVLAAPVVVAARDLLPSDTATLDRSKVLAIVTEIGGSTSHSAIIARSYEIPAVLGIPGLMEAVQQGQTAAVDALAGELVLEPSEEQQAAFAEKRAEYQKKAAEIKKYLDTQPLTADGVHIDIGLNIGSADDEEMAGARYTDLVGLFRTEFLYMNCANLPDEDAQYESYKTVLETFAPRPVTLRTLDIGGDKTLECMALPKEDNPFLGNRALRLCFSQPALFRTQLRAALRASVHGQLWLMLPMVGSIDDIRRAKGVINDVRAELEAEGVPVAANMKTGIMVEIPSIALVADLAAKGVDFASIGTNDLCQYLTAVDRLNPDVASYYQSFHPALFRLIGSVVQEFNKAGKPICVCGEMGGDTLAAPVLVGLGMRKLSMGIASVAPVKRALAGITVAKAEELAKTVVNLPTAAEVEAYLRQQLGE